MYNSERVAIYKTLLALGFIGLIWGIVSVNPFFLLAGIVMTVIGMRSRKYWPVT